MGILENPPQAAAYALSTRTTIGRSSSNAVVLPMESVSGIHASIDWVGDQWNVRDLGSRNGTFLEGDRLAPFEAVPLTTGASIAFGGPDYSWRLAESGPPQIAARSASGRIAQPIGDALTLGDLKSPAVVTLIRDGLEWEYEAEGVVQFAIDQVRIDLGSESWTLLVPEVLSETTLIRDASKIEDLTLRFIPNRNEEHIELQAEGSGVHEHFDHRAHFYLLLTLARLRVEDAKREDLPVAEHGWVERSELEHMLRIDTQHLNLLVYRAQRQFAEIGLRDSTALIERRTGSSQLRIGTGDLVIVPPT